MNLKDWTSLSTAERLQLRQKWRSVNPAHSNAWKELYLEALRLFQRMFQDHPEVFGIESVINFAPGIDPPILVHTFSAPSQDVEDLPREWHTFQVKQLPAPYRYRVAKRDGTFAVFETMYAADGTPQGIAHTPVVIQGSDLEELRWLLKRVLRALDEPPLDYESVQQYQYGYSND